MTQEPYSEGFLDVGDGHALYWAAYGDRNAPPLLVIHGGSGHIINMDELNPPADRHIIVVHQRGVGRSLPYGKTTNNTINDNIDDIERLRAHLNIDKLDIFSWSFGAVFMAAYAFRHPQNCRSLCAYAPYLGSDEDYKVLQGKYPDLAKAYYDFHGGSAGRVIVSSVFNKAAHADPETRLRAYHAASSIFSGAATALEDMRATKTPDEWDRLFKAREIGAALDYALYGKMDRFLAKEAIDLPCPVTLIYGDKDGWSAPHAYADQVFPTARKIILNDASHMLDKAGFQAALECQPAGKKTPGPKPPAP